uniref:Poly [ADP-ribose] polymerase 14 n=1 Tax=Magallana gigas TaxID=29159 RepID=K1PMA1_MAGGI
MVYVQDITSASVEAIVNPANEDLANTGGCADIISTAAGPTFESDCKEIITKKKKVEVTENEISGPGKLPFKCIINAVGPKWASYDDNHKISCLDDLYLTIRKVLDTSEKKKIKSVAILPISSGTVLITATHLLSLWVYAQVLLLVFFAQRFFKILEFMPEFV